MDTREIKSNRIEELPQESPQEQETAPGLQVGQVFTAAGRAYRVTKSLNRGRLQVKDLGRYGGRQGAAE